MDTVVDSLLCSVQEVCRVRGRSVAVVEISSDSGETLGHTYEEFLADATVLAGELAGAGVGEGHLVALDMPARYDALVAFFAVWMCGAAYLPLDHHAPAERNAAILDDARPCAVVAVSADPGLLVPEDHRELVDGRFFCALRDGARTLPPDTAYVIYTSGTTGKPKGVPVTHWNLVALFGATAPWFDVGPGDAWLVSHTMAFDFSVWEIWGALATGGRAVVPDRWIVRDVRRLTALVAEQGVTVLSQTPTAFRALGPALTRAGAARGLRYVVFGGERLLPGFLREVVESSPTTLYNMYGITEVTVHATIREITGEDIAADASVIGAPLAGFTSLVVDEQGREVENGESGELLLAGPQVVDGYLARPELTARRFVDRDGLRFYRSGDLVRRDPERPGELVFLGRIDDQVQVRGYRVEIGEVEQAAGRVASVVEVYVVAVDGDEGEVALACAYAAADDRDITRRTWIAELGGRLPRYMIPAFFHRMTSFPRTANGKIDRRALQWHIQQLTQG